MRSSMVADGEKRLGKAQSATSGGIFRALSLPPQIDASRAAGKWDGFGRHPTPTNLGRCIAKMSIVHSAPTNDNGHIGGASSATFSLFLLSNSSHLSAISRAI